MTALSILGLISFTNIGYEMKILYSILTLAIISLPSVSAENENLNNLVGQWLDIESQKGQLQVNWNTRQQQLEQSQELLSAEISVLKQTLKQADTKKTDVDKRRVELSEKQSLLEQEQVQVKQQIAQATQFSRTLITRLPPPLQTQWQERILLLSQEGVSDSEKLERLLSLFKLVHDFDERIALNRSSMEIPSAAGKIQNLLVTQMYLGVSQGWYVSDDGLFYGFGRAGKLGWNWWHNEAASAELGRVLNPKDLLKLKSILQKPTTAEFINLPVKVSEAKEVS